MHKFEKQLEKLDLEICQKDVQNQKFKANIQNLKDELI